MAGGQALQGVRLPTATEMGWQGHSPGTDTEPQQRAGARPESTRGRTFASVMALWGRRDVIGTHAAFGQRGQSRQLANDPVPCLPPRRSHAGNACIFHGKSIPGGLWVYV